MAERRVCVTGAGGYVASWLVKLLLSKGFVVHGTVRDPCDKKNAHLKKMENSGNLKLFKADVLDYESMAVAVAGCEGVFHAACPVLLLTELDPEVEMIRPAVQGTLNVLKACSAASVRRVVLVSSLSAVVQNPNYPLDRVMDEDSWQMQNSAGETRDYLQAVIQEENVDYPFMQNWYDLAKTLAEKKALEYSKSSGLNVVTICSSMNLGPLLQETLNDTSLIFAGFFKGKRLSLMEYHALYLVDVRDVANASLLIYERSEASGRYICSPYLIKTADFCDMCKSLYPNFDYPDCAYKGEPYHEVTSAKLEKLGWEYKRLEETIKDTIEDLVSKGVLDFQEGAR